MNKYQDIVMGDVYNINYDLYRLIHGTTEVRDVFLSLCLFSTEGCPKRFVDLYKTGQQKQLENMQVTITCIKNNRGCVAGGQYLATVSKDDVIITIERQEDYLEILVECPIEAMGHYRLV